MPPPFVGNIAIRAMKSADFVATIFDGTETGLIAALAYAGVSGKVVLGPGNLTITTIIAVPQACELWLGPGTYTFSGASGISLGAFATLRGHGYGQTSLEPDTTFSSGDIVHNLTQDGTQQAAFIYSLQVNGKKSTCTVPIGIKFKGIGQISIIRDVVVFSCSGVGIHLEGVSSNAGNPRTENVWVNACDDHGIRLTGKFGAYSFNGLTCETIPAGKAGLFIDGTASDTLQGAVWIRDFHCEVLAATAIGILISSAHDVTVDGARYFGSGGNGDLIQITGLAADSYNILLRGIYDRFNALANTVNDVTTSVQLHNQVPIYYLANPRFQGNVTTTGTEDITGNLTARGASNQFGTAGVSHVTQFGQGASSTDQADVIVRAGSSGTTKARTLLQRNGQTDLLHQIDGTLEYMQFRHAFQFGTTAGAAVGLMTTAGKLRLGDGGTPTQGLEVVGSPLFTGLTTGKYPKISTGGLIIDGPTPLAGTKIYWVSDTSGGAVTRKLTFTDGILTAET